MDVFRYDFGYAWPWNYGHLVAVVAFGVLAMFVWRRGLPRWIGVLSLVVAVWGVVGLLIVQLVVRMNLPLELPTERFLTDASGHVLDAGAGSGRAALMVLLSRPNSSVLALDLYAGDFGIPDNTPERLYRNAGRAGVRDRIEAKVGDMRDMPIADDSFDAAVSAYAIDHLRRSGIERSLSEIARVLRPGGQLLLMVINPDVWMRVAYPFFVDHGYFGQTTSHERWRTQLTDAGLEIVEQGTTPGTLYLLARKHAPVTRAATR